MEKLLLKGKQICRIDLDGSIQEVIDQLVELKVNATQKGFFNLRVENEWEGGYYLYGDRYETDKELDVRLQKEEKKRELIESREREQYEILKKKFG